jgi:putative membrane protein
MSRGPIVPIVTLLVLIVAGGPAPAQTGNAAGITPGTDAAAGAPVPHDPNQADRIFMQAAARGGLAEVDFGKLALQAGQNPAVQAFAMRMVSDHEKANQELTTLAAGDDIVLPTKLDPEHADLRARLQGLKGIEFDRAYLQSQLIDHQRNALLLAYEIDAGQDAELLAFSKRTLPVVLEHLQMAQDAATKLWAAAPQGADPSASMKSAAP